MAHHWLYRLYDPADPNWRPQRRRLGMSIEEQWARIQAGNPPTPEEVAPGEWEDVYPPARRPRPIADLRRLESPTLCRPRARTRARARNRRERRHVARATSSSDSGDGDPPADPPPPSDDRDEGRS